MHIFILFYAIQLLKLKLRRHLLYFSFIPFISNNKTLIYLLLLSVFHLFQLNSLTPSSLISDYII